MKRNRLYWAVALACAITIAGYGCSQLIDQSNPTGPRQTLNPMGDSMEVKSRLIEPMAAGYPSYCFALNVPFLPQVPPGDWGSTKNCGQTCGVMLGGYFNGGAVASWVITSENNWLAGYTGDNRYRDANGWYTSGSRLNAFRSMLWAFHRVNTAVYYGRNADDVVSEVAKGRPTLVGVRISGVRLVGSGGAAHWALAVGWNGNIILHDPGSSSGRFIQYSIATFEDS